MGECSYSSQTQHRNPLDEFGIRLCKTSPKFLESNATSHTWVFSAIAELIDNAYDPDVRATQIRIDQQIINGRSCLSFIDDGNGLDEDQLYRMLSLGYSDKSDNHDYKPIGRYGNGFKSGSMRLGKDAIVLTKQKRTLSVGLLSQTFHELTKADTVRIPIVTFDRETLQLAEPVDQNEANLRAILKYSIFTSEDDLMDQLTVVPDFDPSLECGTKIIIWNLRELGLGRSELYYRREIGDIVYNDPDFYSGPAAGECASDSLDYLHSLKQYCSVLYLRPRMKIYILGKKVPSRLIAKDLCKTEVDRYTMKTCPTISITFGFNPTHGNQQKVNDYGIVMYYKNRLIKAYEKVGYQKQATGQGSGVVGVVEADFLTPNHNKQSFNIDEKYHKLMNALARKLNEYWDAKTSGEGREKDNEAESAAVVVKSEELLEPDCNWIQCDECLKWRRLPPGSPAIVDGLWYCSMHPNEEIRSQGCRAVEDKLDQGEIDLNVESSYRQEKKKAANSKRKQGAGARKSVEATTAHEEEAERAKRRRVEDNRRPALVNDVRRKIDQLNRHTQSLLAEPAVAVGDVAEALHREHGGGDASRLVLCTKCNAWKKLPIGGLTVDTNTWECKKHPDESQRECQAIDSDQGGNRSSSSDTDQPAGPSGLSQNRKSVSVRRSSSYSAEIDIQGKPAVIVLDTSDDEGADDDQNFKIKDLKQELEDVKSKLASALDFIKRQEQLSSEKRESCHKEVQTMEVETVANTTTDTTTQTQPAACPSCEGEQAKLREARVQVARLLNILLDDVQVRPETAFETVALLIKNEKTEDAQEGK